MSEQFGGNVKKFYRKTGNGISTSVLSEIGKIPPQAVDMEEVVLGALMLERDAISVVIEILQGESFYKDEHKEIYTAIRSLFEKSQPIDILTVTNELRQKGKLDFVGGAFYISELTNRVSSAANIEYHARIVAQKHILRRLIEVCSKIQTDAYEETSDVFDLLDMAEKELFSITEQNLRSSYDNMSQLISKALTQMEEMRNNSEGLSGIPSGFSGLDRITSGWQRSDLIILAARPGMGKTAFVLSLARNASVTFKKPVAVFSLEMSSLQLVLRLISSEAEINSMKLKTGDLEDHEWHQLHTKISKLSQAPLYIDDTPALNVFELRAKCRRLKAQHGIDMIIIDYLQLMAAGKEGKSSFNREQEISTISRALKQLAKELNVPVIALSQLSRAVEQRGGTKKPLLSDLRESGSIEQDADQVLFIYRPEYYGLTEDEEGRPTTGMAEIIIAKNRHGALESVPLRFIDKFARFADMDEFSFQANDANFPPSSFGGGGLGDDHPGPNFSSITRGSRMNEDLNDEEAPF
jgi:replicative DNA helicase